MVGGALSWGFTVINIGCRVGGKSEILLTSCCKKNEKKKRLKRKQIPTVTYRAHLSPSYSLCSSHTSLLAVPQIFQGLSHLRAFTLVVPFAWNASLPHLLQLKNSKVTSPFKLETTQPLILPFLFLLCIFSLALITI